MRNPDGSWPPGSIFRYLDDVEQIIEAVEHSADVSLHSATVQKSSAPHDGICLASLAPKKKNTTSADNIQLQVLHMPETRRMLKDYRNAGSDRRAELEDSDIRLYSVLSTLYCPTPLFQKGHDISDTLLKASRTGENKEKLTWLGLLENLPWCKAIGSWQKALGLLAQNCHRLDNAAGQVGSGSMLGNGQILTAAHLITQGTDGDLFGNPPDAAGRPGFVRINQVENGTGELNVRTGAYSIPSARHDLSLIRPAPGWRDVLRASPLAAEFSQLKGLPMLVAELSEEALRGRPVAVIGHPARGGASDSERDVAQVFTGPLQLKRLALGRLDSTTPIKWLPSYSHRASSSAASGDEVPHLMYNCSTLSGSSGACLLDLITGTVLGVHCGGNARKGNFAIPTWEVMRVVEEAG